MNARFVIVLVLSALILSAGCGVSQQPPSGPWGRDWDDHGTATRPLENIFVIPEGLEAPLVLVPVTYKDQSYSFLLDTGSSSVLFGPRLRSSLGPSLGKIMVATTKGAQVAVPLFSPPEAFLGDIDLREGGAIAYLDFEFARDYGLQCDGIIGMSLLCRYIVQIDYPNSTVRIMTADGKEHPEWGVSMPMYCTASLAPAIRAEFGNDFPVRIMLDTGAKRMGSLSPWAMQKISKGNPILGPKIPSVGLGGLSFNRQFLVPELRLGEYVYQNIMFEESASPGIGAGLLSRHKVTFDFPNKRLYLSPPDDPRESTLPYVAGIRLMRKSSQLVVYHVATDSSAEKSGVRAGDVILQIDGRDTKNMPVWQAIRLLRAKHSKKIHLNVQRDRRTLDISVMLVEMPGLAIPRTIGDEQ